MLERIGFPIMAALGLAQSPRDGARKYADCLIGKIGRDGDVIGAPAGKALGPLTDQKPMNPAFENDALAEVVWSIATDIAADLDQAHTTPVEPANRSRAVDFPGEEIRRPTELLGASISA